MERGRIDGVHVRRAGARHRHRPQEQLRDDGGRASYTFDAEDRVTGQTINGVTQAFGYDNLDQVTSNNGAALTYDASGNRTVSGYVIGAGNRVTGDGTWTYTHDDTGAVTGKSKSGEAWAYTYDLNGQMTSASKSATVGGTVTDAVAYTYDAWGNRVSRTQSGTTSSTERYVMDGWDTAKGHAAGTENFDTTIDLNGSNAVTGRRLFGAGFDAAAASRDADGAVSWYGPRGCATNSDKSRNPCRKRITCWRRPQLICR